MSKVKLQYTGLHLPKEVVEVDEFIVDGLIKRGDYSRVGKVEKKKVEEVSDKPDFSWSEKRIKKWMDDNEVSDVKYDVKRETKAEKLRELKGAGYI